MKKNAKDLVFVVVPKVITGACTLGCNIVLLRFFGPEKFGIYSLCLSFILISDAVLGSALDLGVMRLASASRDDAASSLSFQAAGLALKAAATLVLTIALILYASFSQVLSHHPDRNGLVGLSLLAVLALMMLRSAQMHVQIQERFWVYGCLELFSVSLRFGGIALLLVLGRGTPGSVLFCAVLGPCAAALLWLVVWGRDFLRISRITQAAVGELLGYVKWYLISFGVAALVSRTDIFLLASWSNLREVGLFSAGQTLAYVPQLMGSYLAVWLNPKVMPSWREGRFYAFFMKFQSGMLIACVCAYVLGVVSIKALGPWLLPKAFLPSQEILLVLLPGSLAGLLTFPLTLTFLLFIRPKFLVTMDCLSLPLMIPLYRFAIHSHGAIGAAWVTSSAFLVKALVAQVVAWRLARAGQQEAAPGLCMPPARLTSV